MFPRIKKNKEEYKFDSRLDLDELQLLCCCLGETISSLRLEHVEMSFYPKNRISTYGRCCFQLKGPNNSIINIIFQSLFKELRGPIVDQGGLIIQKIITENSNSRDKLLVPVHEIDKSFVVNISYPNRSPVKKIMFYGNQESGNIKELDKDTDLDYLNQLGFTTFPLIKCDSIEFFVIEHEDKRKSIVSLKDSGFWFNLNVEEELTDSVIQDSYIKVNGYKKNIILQHEIK